MEAVATTNIERSASMNRPPQAEIPESQQKLIQKHLAPLNLDSIDEKSFAATLDCRPFGSGSIRRIELSAGALTLHNDEQSHSGVLALLQVSGSSTLLQSVVDSTIVTGDLVVVDCSQPFRLTTQRSSCYLVIVLPAESTTQAFDPGGAGSIHISGSVGSCAIAANLMRTFFDNAQALCKEDPNPMLELLSSVLERAVLASDGRPALPSHSRSYHLRRIKRYTCEHLRDPALKPGTIAKAVGVSRRYLDNLFQTQDTSIARYIWARRLQGCKRDLADSRLVGRSITEIAFSWGFNSASHFSRTFSERYGVSPSQARGRNCNEQPEAQPLCAAM
jgi:AraC family transcriptional activator of tynA and feaB